MSDERWCGYQKRRRTVENDVSKIRIRTPRGGFVPVDQVAERSRGQAPTSITREDGLRSINVRADLAPGVPSSREVLTDVENTLFPALKEKYPGLELGFAGEQRDQQETMASLGQNYLLALLAIYGLLAIPFKSYIQPFIIMSAIPFGFVGAVAGHMLMGFSLSVISMFGIVALTGVVVNDSLVLIDAANNYRLNGETPIQGCDEWCKTAFPSDFIDITDDISGAGTHDSRKVFTGAILDSNGDIARVWGSVCNWDYPVDRSITVYDC